MSTFRLPAAAAAALLISTACASAEDTTVAVPDVTIRHTEAAAQFDQSDEIAALTSLQYALTEVADGSTYVWHRKNGRLSGMVMPTRSFKDARGDVCRHIVVVLNSAEKTTKTEGVACRLSNRIWKLDG